MKTKLQIKHNATGAILFEFEKEGNTQRDTILEAIRQNADLRYADLRYADLRSANLSYANLSSADLSYADLRYADLSYADLRSANLRYADLRSANLSYANGLDYWWHVHHEILVEVLTEPIKNRINYIKNEKPEDERELRLRLLKPVLGDFPTTKAGWNKLHKVECNCGWNNKTIFTKKNGLVKE